MKQILNLQLFSSKLPVVLQTETNECGLACLAMVAAFHGQKSELHELRARYTLSGKGMGLPQIISIAKQLGMEARPLRLELSELPNLKTPCILHWNFEHFVVLKKVRGGIAWIHDPAHGIRKLTKQQLSDAFTGVALELWPTVEFEKREAAKSLRMRPLLGKVVGLGNSLTQILILALALEIAILLNPLFMQLVIDNALVSEDIDLLTTLVLSFGLMLVVQQLLSAMRAWMLIYMSTSIGVQWQSNIFAHLVNLPAMYFERRTLGDVSARFGSANAIQKALTSSIVEGFIDGLLTVLTLVMMFAYSPALGGVAVCAVMIYAIARIAWYQPLKRASEEFVVFQAKQHSHFLETVRGIKAIKLFSHQQARHSRWLSLLVAQINAELKGQKLALIYQQLNGVLVGITTLTILWMGAKMVMEGQFTIGMLVAFTAYKTQFMSRVASLIDRVFEFYMLQVHGNRLADIVCTRPDEDEAPTKIKKLDGSIEVVDLSFRYGDTEPEVLRGINIKVTSGECVAIAGQTGCGKSTLANILLGLLSPQRGSISIGGEDVGNINAKTLRRTIGTVLQDDTLFSGSISDNISMFSSDLDLEKVESCARLACVHDEIVKFPMGYNTLVGENGTTISGGQRQRILLARALYKDPSILVLDEATSHLDIRCEAMVNSAVRQLDITRVIIAHRPETIASADRVIVLHDGKVFVDCPPAQVMARLFGGAVEQLPSDSN